MRLPPSLQASAHVEVHQAELDREAEGDEGTLRNVLATVVPPRLPLARYAFQELTTGSAALLGAGRCSPACRAWS